MPATPRLLSLAACVPRYTLDQADVIRRVRMLFGEAPGLEKLLPVFANTGIRQRYSCVPIEWYDDAHSWPERNRIYLEAALDLIEQTALQLIERAGIDKHAIDA